MLRVVSFLIAIAIAASGLSWLADRPGSLVVNWQGYEIETSVFRATVLLVFFVGLSILAWSILTAIWRSPASVGAFFNRRRQMRGLEALSGGMIAIGSGDQVNATRYAVQARKALPNEPMTQLLRAQAAQLSGDRATARRMFEAMLGQPETEQLGLRGLFLEAEREGEREAARQFAERSVELNPRLPWAVDALFELQCKDKDWEGALATLSVAKKHHHHDKAVLDRRRAVVMTARALAIEEVDPNRALSLALEAHNLAQDLVPASVLAGRMLAAKGQTKRATKIIERTWRRAPHPDLAMVYAYARLGDSPRDRLERVKRLAQHNPHSVETPIAIATTAIEAKAFGIARQVLEGLDASRMTQRICMLMARVEGEEHGDKGRVREWLARAVHAPRDPAWVADGVASERWAPVSPVTGAFDAFQWRVPVDALDVADADLLAAKLEQIVKLGTPVAAPLGAEGIAAAVVVAEAAEKVEASKRAAPSREAVDAVTVTAAPAASAAPAATPAAAARPSGAKGSVRAATDGSSTPAAASTPAQAAPAAAGIRAATAEMPSRPGGVSADKVDKDSKDIRSEPVKTPGMAAAKSSASATQSQVREGVESRASTVATGASAPGDANSQSASSAKPIPSTPTAPADAKAVNGKADATKPKPLEPSVFIAPRPPDDPGVKPKDETAAGERPKSPPLTVVSGKR